MVWDLSKEGWDDVGVDVGDSEVGYRAKNGYRVV